MKFGTIVKIFSGKDDQWYFHTVSGNHRIGDVSEGYTRKTDCVRAAKRWHPGVPIEVQPRKELK
jgi:uncharacterized protein YegP (UPF0339 family)